MNRVWGKQATRSLALWGASAAAVFAIVCLWTVRHAPIQDGPAHVWTTSAWAEFGNEPIVAEWAQPNMTIAPNWSATVVMRLFEGWLSPHMTQTVIVTLLVVFFIVAMGYAITAVRPGGLLLLVFAVPMAFHLYLYRGSFNFSFGLATMLLAIGLWLRHGDRPSVRHGIILAALLVITYFSHPVPFLATLTVIAVLALALAGRSWRTDRAQSGRALGTVALAAIPSLTLLFIYTAGTESTEGFTLEPKQDPIRWVLDNLSMQSLLESLDIAERPWVLLFASSVLALLAFGLWAKLRARHWSWTDGVLLGAILLTLAAFVIPGAGFGNTASVPNRLMLCVAIISVVWAASVEVPTWALEATVAIALIASLGLTWSRIEPYQRFDDEFQEIVAAVEHVQPDSSIFPIVLWKYLEPPFHKVMPPMYAGSWISQMTDGADLGNLDLGVDYHVMKWRDLDPDVYDWIARYTPADTFPSRTDGPAPDPGIIDYVLLIGPVTSETVDEPIASWLEEDYELAFESPNGIAHLYRPLVVAGG